MWLKLTAEAFPRLSRVREVRDDGATYLGPFSGARQVELATAALHEAFRLRQCTTRLSPRRVYPRLRAGRDGPLRRAVRRQRERRGVRRARRRRPRGDARRRPPGRRRAVAARWPGWPRSSGSRRPRSHRDRLAAFVRAAARMQRLSALTRCAELVAARPARRRRLGDRRGPARPARGHRGRRPGRGPAGRRPRPWSTPPRSSRPGTGPTPAGLGRGDRVRAALARGARHPAGLAHRHLGLPTYGAGGVRLWAEAAEQRPRPARPVRRPPRHPAGAPAGRRGQPDRLTLGRQLVQASLW